MSVKYEVVSIILVEGTEDEVLERAASVNYLGDFSGGEALVSEAKQKGLKPLLARKFENIPGRGAKALIDGIEVRVGSPKFLIDERISVPVSFGEKITALAREAKIVIVVLSGRSLSGAIILSEMPREDPVISESRHKVAPLRSRRWLIGVFAILGFAILIFLLV